MRFLCISLAILFISILKIYPQSNLTELFDNDLLKHLEGDLTNYKYNPNNFNKINPDDVAGFLARGVKKIESGFYQEALQDIKESLKLYPEYPAAFYFQGICYERLDSLSKAQKSFEKAIELDPIQAGPYNELGNLYMKKGKFKQAKELYKKTLEKDSKYVLAYYNLGVCNILTQNLAKATKNFEEIIEKDSAFAPAYFQIAQIYLMKENKRKAVQFLDKTIHFQPKFGEAYFMKGLINLFDLKPKLDKVIQEWDKAIKISPKNPIYLTFRGNLHIELKNYEKAIEDFTQAFRLNPIESDNYKGGQHLKSKQIDLQFAVLYFSENIFRMSLELQKHLETGLCLFIGKDYQASLKHYDKAIELNNKNAIAYFLKGLSYEYLNNFDEAFNYYTKAIKFDVNIYDAYKKRGLLNQEDKKYDEALKDFNEMLRIKPKAILGFKYRGIIKMHLNDFKGSIEDFTAYIQKDSTDNDIFFNRAQSYKVLAFFKEALQDYELIASRKPYDLEAIKQSIECAFALKDFQNVIKQCNQYLEDYPKNESILNLKGLAYKELGEYNEALSNFDQILLISPNNKVAFTNKGLVYILNKEYEIAIQNLDKVTQLDYKNELAYYFKGLAKYYLGKHQEACQDMQQAIKLGMDVPKDLLQAICK